MSAAAKLVVVTGDDFGLSPEVNAGILRAHREGVLRGTSMMSGEPSAAAAAAAAREAQGLEVGLHLTVCRGRSRLGRERLGTLVDASGEFARNPTLAGMRYFFDRRIRDALRAESCAQLERHLELVGYLHHIDGHLNFHVHPVLAAIVIDLAVEHKVPFIRIPCEPVMATLRIARDQAARKTIEAAIFRALSRRMRRMAAARGIRSTDRLFGLHQSGHLTERYLLEVIRRIPAGTTELYFHPADDVGGMPPSAATQRDLHILISPAVRAAFDREGIVLTNFAELAAGKAAALAESGSIA